ARSAGDVAAAIRFARRHRLRLVVKGGGHSYQGGSNAAGSLLVWTRQMRAITLHDAFVPTGSEAAPVPAVTVEAGALWGEVYREVCVRGGRYVQGGGYLTVGVAGLVQSGGFGSFSKAFGTAAASLLAAEIVTADSRVRTVNATQEPDLLFALKGGGGGTFGVVTRLTLATHDLPPTLGAVFAEVRASSPTAFRRLIAEMLTFYAENLLDPHWGEQIVLRPGNVLALSMSLQGLSQAAAERVWAPFWARLRAEPEAFRFPAEPTILAVPARSYWDPAFLRTLPGVVLGDDRPGAPPERIFWAGNREEAGQILHAYQSAWLGADLLAVERRDALADALFAASRQWSLSLHTNKGLAGSPASVESAAATAMNPAVRHAFALVICGAEGPPAYPGIPGHEPDVARARQDAARVRAAMAALKERIPTGGSYLAESDFFEPDWQQAFWGANHARLTEIKRRYDPDGMFTIHHGIQAAG
ncbi:FAD-dependent oxidoreductase, partial [Geminicoccus harenae]